MTAPAVIRGTLSEIKPVKTRSIWQIVVEIPVEQAQSAIDTLGVPVPGKERWVAVALLDAASSAPQPAPAPEPDKPRRRFQDLPRSQQAGMRCEEPEFASWMKQKNPGAWNASGGEVAGAVRWLCAVNSRAELNTDPVAGRLWDHLNTQYLQDTGRMATDPRSAA
jgi:hypothetical protein